MIKTLKKIFEKRTHISSQTKAKGSTVYGGRGERELQLKLELSVYVDGKRRAQLFDTAKALTAFNMVDQDRFLQAVQDCIDQDIAFALCRNGIPALRAMNLTEWDEWLKQIKQKSNTTRPYQAVEFINDIESYLELITPSEKEVLLQKAYAPLEMFLAGLGGNCQKIAVGEAAYTDTDTIYLPAKCDRFNNAEDNFNFYKVLLTYLWAQIAFGTWRIDIATLLYNHSDPDKAVELYRVLETLRIDGYIKREFSGTHRLIKHFGDQQSLLPKDEEWSRAVSRLQAENASCNDSLELLESLYSHPLPEVASYQGQFFPRQVNRAIKARSEMDKKELQNALTQLLKKTVNTKRENNGQYTLKFYEQLSDEQTSHFILANEDEKIEIPENIREILERIAHDLGKVPQDYLKINSLEEKHGIQTAQDEPLESDIIAKLPEWDYATQRQRPEWCHILLKSSDYGDEDFAVQTRLKHRGIVRRLNRTFEALREENRIIKKQAAGDEIDIDATIEAQIDYCVTKNEMDENIFTRINKNQRNVAVMFMVDTSSSTRGMVNTIERESLILLCDSLNLLGDNYAIYGFNSNTRKNCYLYPIKMFDEAYNASVTARIAGITANGYTRIGASVRYFAQHLITIPARTKLLILLSDGKPDDIDGYRGQYGIEDTRRALLEARASGILPYCITIDKQAKDYLPYMYGHASYSMISQVEELPFKMADIYRRITS